MTIFGSECARVYTPPLRDLTPETSLGFEVIDFAEHILGVHLMPWQKWWLIHALELKPDGNFRFRTVLLLVARQNGKSTLLQVLTLWRLYVEGALVLGTAQNLSIAEEQWAAALVLAEDVPRLASEITHTNKTVGKHDFRLANRGRYVVRPGKSARGFPGIELVLTDELREHRTWTDWSAATKTVQARARAQVVAASNAGDIGSVVLKTLRDAAHKAIEDGATAETALGIFEWSALDGCAVDDLEGLAAANPALGHTVAIETLLADAEIAKTGTEAEWVHRTEVLCQWRPTVGTGPFPSGAWELCRDPESSVADLATVRLVIEVSWDGSAAHVVLAGQRADKDWHLEVIASRAGTAWLTTWFDEVPPGQSKKRRDLYPRRYVQKGSPAAFLADDLGCEVIAGSDITASCAALFAAVVNRTVWHLDQPVLDAPASAASTRPIGESWVIDRKGPVDASPLMGAALALQMARSGPPPARSAYEDRGLLLV